MKAFLTVQVAVVVAVACCLCSSNASLTEELQALSEKKPSPEYSLRTCVDYRNRKEWLNNLVGSIPEGTMKNREANCNASVLNTHNRNTRDALFSTRREGGCTCQSSVSLVDLGQRAYPRYLTSAVCNNSLCGGYDTPCQAIHHTTYVLRSKKAQKNIWPYVQEEETDGELTEVAAVVDTNVYSYTLPGSLSRKWKLDGIRVVAACVCMS